MSALTGGPLPRALGARGEPRNLVHFADARLVSLPGSAYVELAKPEIDNDAFGCSFCNKTTTHEHEFNGRIKFEPREERYFISFIRTALAIGNFAKRQKLVSSVKSKDKEEKTPLSSSDRNRQDDKDVSIRMRDRMEEVQDANKEDGSFKVGKAGGLSKIEGSEPIQPKRAASKIYPLIAVSEVECQKLFHDALKTFGLQNGRNNCIVAIKTADTGMLYLVQAQKKSAEVVVGTTRSVLKSTFARGSLADFEDCTDCQVRSFDSVKSLVSHFQSNHRMDVKLKAVLLKEKTKTGIVTKEGRSTVDTKEDNSCLNKTTPAAEGRNVVEGVGKEQCSMFSNETFSCEKCEAEFSSDAQAIQHANSEHAAKGQMDYQCDVCLLNFKDRQLFKRHRNSHGKVPIRNHACQLCSKTFLKVQHLQDHLNTHLGVKLHPCQLCDKKYSSAATLKSHQINVHQLGDRPSCPECSKTFYNPTLLNKHILQEHKRDTRLACPICNQFYLRKNNLDDHIKTAHRDEDKLVCKLCEGVYGTKDSLSEHLTSTHGVLPWNSQEDLEKELSGAGQLKCKICEHNFLPAEMETHLRFSHGVMPVKRGSANEFTVSEAAEALLRTLTPQPDYLLRCLTPLPMETLDDFITQNE